MVLGAVVRDPGTEEQRALLPSVVDAAGLAIEIARLRVELRRRLDEMEASRARLVTVADNERRRIERDLHDGAQQRLVSIGLALRHAQHELGHRPAEASRVLDGAVAEITVAIDELRELARGLRPASLDAGLGPALRELAGRAPLPVEVTTTGERFAPEVETTAYFVACEALTNAVKHARAARVALCVAREDTKLVVTVADDGVGGATPAIGSGLAGLADRVAARGGRLRIDTARGHGTTLIAELPCAS
jgi:signal transduction histidine kinase